jgi:S-disulfanyl-L-cysteine oxidoreductase SoxD
VHLGLQRPFFVSVLSLAAGGGVTEAALADGFTADQATVGQTAYNSSCARCHGAKLEGVEAPALAGRDVMQNFGTAGGLYDFISVSMPPDAPGSLGEKTYLDIIAYVLSFNGARPGNTALAKNGELYNLSLAKQTAAGTTAAAPSTPLMASAAVPQAYTWGKQLPGGETFPKTTKSSVPQAFTWGKKLPQANTQ